MGVAALIFFFKCCFHEGTQGCVSRQCSGLGGHQISLCEKQAIAHISLLQLPAGREAICGQESPFLGSSYIEI